MEFFGQPGAQDKRPFSRAVKAGGMVWVSGHSAPHDPARGIHRGATPAEEVRNALAFIAGLLAEAGSGLDRVVQVTMLISDRADYAACNAEYVTHFPGGCRRGTRCCSACRPRRGSASPAWHWWVNPPAPHGCRASRHRRRPKACRCRSGCS